MNNKITLVTAFKKFHGNYNMIQKSAMYSWKANDLHVVVPNNEVDTKASCVEYPNITVIEGVKRGLELGFHTQSPVIKNLLEKAMSVTETPMLAFMNSDIILLKDFSERCDKIFEKHGFDMFIAGTRYDIRLNYYVNNPESYEVVQKEKRNPYDPHTSSDIIITSKFTWRKILESMPEFVMGRFCWDNWLHSYAEVNRLNKYNCTSVLPLLHCEHDLIHIKLAEGAPGRDAPSAKHNFALYKPMSDIYGRTQVSNWVKIEI